MVETRELADVRARMAAWDRSFLDGHGRHPDEREWANAARVVGHLPFDQAERLARETYRSFGPGAAEAVVRPDYQAFLEAVVARRGAARTAAARRAVKAPPAEPLLARAAPIVAAGLG